MSKTKASKVADWALGDKSQGQERLHLLPSTVLPFLLHTVCLVATPSAPGTGLPQGLGNLFSTLNNSSLQKYLMAPVSPAQRRSLP